jgi:hypothetical protein
VKRTLKRGTKVLEIVKLGEPNEIIEKRKKIYFFLG